MAKKAKASGVGALLAKTAKKAPAAKAKKGTPVVTDGTDAVKSAIKEWLKHKQDEKTAESKRKMAEAILRPVCQEARRSHIQETGTHTTSVKLNGDVTYKTNKSYSKIPTDKDDELIEIFGEGFGATEEFARTVAEDMAEDIAAAAVEDGKDGEKAAKAWRKSLKNGLSDEVMGEANWRVKRKEFERLFHVHTDIKLTEKAAADDEILTALIEAVGEERFGEIFEVVQYIAPNDALIVERDLNPEVAEKHDDAVEQGLVKPYSASFVAG